MPPTGQQVPRLGRYQLIERLATGGTAEILLAERADSGPGARRYAIKRLLDHHTGDPEALRMLVNEAQLTASFQHPNIVHLVEHDTASPQPYMVMELIEGLDLRTLLSRFQERGQRVSVGLATGIMIQVLDGLAYVHALRAPDGGAMGVVHRDVSPANIMVTSDGLAKLIDFGVMQAQHIEGNTRTGELKGNLCYMAPEQIGGRVIDGRADLFAVGLTLYELVTGVHPFRKANDLATFNAILDEQPGPINRWVRDCPPELEEAVRGALAKSREGRYRNASEMRAALAKVPDRADAAAIAQVVRELTADPSARTVFDPVDAPSDATLPVGPARRALSELSTMVPGDTFPGADSHATLLPWSGEPFEDETIADASRRMDSETPVDHDTALDAAVPMPEDARKVQTVRGRPIPPGANLRSPVVRETRRDAPPVEAPPPVILGSPQREQHHLAMLALALSIVFTIAALLLVLRSRAQEAPPAPEPSVSTSSVS